MSGSEHEHDHDHAHDELPADGPPERSRTAGVRIWIAIAMVPLSLAVGIVYGWRWILAPLLALGLLRWSIASLRVLITDAADDKGLPDVEEGPERTVFHCPECGTELLLLYRGTSRAPSHCGQRMTARTEIVR
jgi:hypothetical protein